MLALSLLAVAGCALGPPNELTGIRYADNGQVRVGIDLGKGGAITFLSHNGGPNMVNDYDLGRQIQMSYYYVLILGDLAKIRAYVYAHPPKSGPPNYRFDRDRQHWAYQNATDEGWPIHRGLRVALEQNDPQLIGPVGFWPAAETSKLFIRAALKTKDRATESAQLFWARSEAGFAEIRSIRFPILGDGIERVYAVDLSNSPEYRGFITRLRFDPEPTGHPGDRIVVRSIGFTPTSE